MSAGIPGTLKPVFDGLHADLVALSVRWQMYRQLYGTSPDRIDLLNKLAPAFFGVSQESLFDDVLSGIARITDKTVVCGRDNLVLRQLVLGLDPTADATLIATLETKWAAVCTACLDITRIRHRRLSHRDLQFALNPSAHPLPPIDRAKVDEALGAIADFMNTFSRAYTTDTYMYAEPITGLGDGKSLLRHLLRAVEYRKMEAAGQVPVIGKV